MTRNHMRAAYWWALDALRHALTNEAQSQTSDGTCQLWSVAAAFALSRLNCARLIDVKATRGRVADCGAFSRCELSNRARTCARRGETEQASAAYDTALRPSRSR